MRKLKGKFISILIALFLTISMTASVMFIPNASAHNPAWSIPTWAYIQALPSPVGVGQQITVYVWLSDTFGSLPGTVNSNAAIGNNYRFHNFQVVITAPNGATTTQSFDTISDPTSSQLFYFTPTQVGTYNFTFTFPGQAYTQYSGGYNPTSPLVNDTYLASSASTSLVVQQDPLPAPIDSFPLPSSYWTHPIYGENSYWYIISSNWLGTGYPYLFSINYARNTFQPDAVGSLTSHVMWTKPIQAGGVVGGNQFPTAPGVGYFEGSAYINRYTNPIIMNGKIYYTEPVAFTAGTGGPTDCVDLRTGQLIWSRNDVPALSFGYIQNFWTPNQHGTWPPLLCTTNFGRVFDADTGDPLFNTTGVPSGTTVIGPNGEHLKYVITNNGTAANPQWMLAEWNSSKMWLSAAGALSPSLTNASGTGTWSMVGSTITVGYPFIVNAGTNAQYDWNVSLPWLNFMGNQTLTTVNLSNGTTLALKGYSATGANPDASNPIHIIAGFYNDVLLCYNGSLPSSGTPFYQESYTPYTYFAVDLNNTHATLGNVLYWQTYNPPAGNVTILESGVDPVARVFYETYKEQMQYVAYNMDTGMYMWGPTAPQPALDYYGNDFGGDLDAQTAYGKLYSVGFAGILYCYDEQTGDLLWTYGNGGEGNSTYSGLNTFYGAYPTFIQAIGNGVIYMDTTEHTITDPIFKGSMERAINATDGTELWTLSSYTGGGNTIVAHAIADGFTTFFNGYDNQIYVVGQGPSRLTVTAPDAGLSFGQPVVIRGTVTDICAGTKQNQQAADFPNGVPVASDVSMKDWMGFVYQQKPMPNNFTGVPVSIDVYDSNGNYRNIGTATTSATGTYSLAWTPDIPGSYQVIATFHGNNAYWGSYAQTAFEVMNAPTATAAPTAAPLTAADMYFVPAIAGLFVLIIVVLVLVALMLLRKRP